MGGCKVADRCGGCEYIGRPYEYQLARKQAKIAKMFSGFGEMGNIVACDEPYYYRNKVHSAFKRIRGGRVICGTYAKGSHMIIERNKCYIENKKAQEIINTVARLASKRKVSIYDEHLGKGLLRRVLVRVSESTGQIMVVLVVGSKYFTGKGSFIADLLREHPEITTVLCNQNFRHDSMILDGPSRAEYGKGYIEEMLLGRKFRISPESFFQVNTPQAEKLYSVAIEMADLRAGHRVLDCYCGTGTITISISGYCKEAVGVEINKKAVADARSNMRINDVDNVRFICRDATNYMEELALSRDEHFDCVIMDPPRSGATSRFIKAVCDIAPERIVYVSCCPETLLRDLKQFKMEGYKTVKITPVDMFPWTEDIECVVKLERIML